jgi:hypothetical protein
VLSESIQAARAVGLPILAVMASLVIRLFQISGIREDMRIQDSNIREDVRGVREDMREIRADIKILNGKVYKVMGGKR